MLAYDTFDRLAAAQLIRAAAPAEKCLAGPQLAQAVLAFLGLGAQNLASQRPLPNLRHQRNEAKKSLRRVNQELVRYQARVCWSKPIKSFSRQATAIYLSENEG